MLCNSYCFGFSLYMNTGCNSAAYSQTWRCINLGHAHQNACCAAELHVTVTVQKMSIAELIYTVDAHRH